MILSDFVSIISDKCDGSSLSASSYLSTENMLPNLGGYVDASSVPDAKVTKFQAGDILLSNIRPYFKKMVFARTEGGCSNDVVDLRANERLCLSKYLYYALSTDSFFDYYTATCKGTKMPRGDKTMLMKFELELPSVDDQRHIVGTIGTIDDLIENLESEKGKIVALRQKKLLKFIEGRTVFEPFTSHARFVSGAQPPKSEHIYEDKKGYVRFIQNRDYDSDSHLTYIPSSKRNKLCSQEDIMVDKYGEAGTVRYGLSGAYNVALMKVVPVYDYESEYIRDFLAQPTIRSILYASSQASTRPSLNESTFTAIKIPVIAKDELLSYEKAGKDLLMLELGLEKEIKTSKLIKTVLLSKYF